MQSFLKKQLLSRILRTYPSSLSHTPSLVEIEHEALYIVGKRSVHFEVSSGSA